MAQGLACNNHSNIKQIITLDRDLAAQGKDFVSIDGDKAIYTNHWLAGGNEIKWEAAWGWAPFWSRRIGGR